MLYGSFENRACGCFHVAPASEAEPADFTTWRLHSETEPVHGKAFRKPSLCVKGVRTASLVIIVFSDLFLVIGVKQAYNFV